MIKKYLISFLPILILALTGAKMSEDGRPGRTGSPGETTCHSCHSSFTQNSGGGSISIQNGGMISNQYTPGQTYSMSVTVSLSSSNLFGVGIEALTSTNNNAGTLIITDATSTQFKSAVVGGVNRLNIVHTLGGGASPASKVFIFNWTAPVAGTGNVTFYFAGNAALGNGNGMDSNDYIYVSSQVFTEAPCAAPSQPGAISGNAVVCSGSSSTYSVASIAGATSYTWTLPSGWSGTSSTESINVTSGNSTGTISVTANNSCGSSTPSSLPVSITNIAVNSTVVNVSCNGLANGSISLNPSGGTSPYSYSWSPSGATTSSITGLAAGNYSVTVTDGIGCTKASSFTVTQPNLITATTSQTNVLCNGGSTGSATVNVSGGTPNYQYAWSPSGGNASTASNLSAGSYTVLVTDSKGCTKNASVTLTQPTVLNVTTTKNNVLCNGDASGNATAIVSGGTPNYFYSWSPTGGTTSTANNLPAGNYTVTVTDANGCTKTSSATITQPTAISISITTSDALCDSSSGSATATPSGGAGGYTYFWSTIPIQTNSTATNLPAGIFIVTVTDANGCTKTANAAVNQPSTLNVNSSVTNISCHGLTDGFAALAVTGGSPGYIFSWNTIPAQTNDTATNLSAGNYTAVVTDSLGCSFTANVTITEPTQLIADAGTPQSICTGSSLIIGGSPTGSGGTAGYTYQWTPSLTLNLSTDENPLATPVSSTNYSVVVTDANGCTTSSTINVGINSLPVPTITTTGDSLYSTPEYSYQWNLAGFAIGGANDQYYVPLLNGIYSVFVTDSNGCSDTSPDFNFTTLSISSIEGSCSIKIFPNPSSNIVNIYSPDLIDDIPFEIYNEDGKCVYKSILQNGNNTIDVRKFAKGFYNVTGWDVNRKLLNTILIIK